MDVKREIEYLTTKEAAALLRIHRRTLEKVRKPDQFPRYAAMNEILNPSRSLGNGGAWLYPRRNVELWIKKSSANGLTPAEIDELAGIVGEAPPSASRKKSHKAGILHFKAPKRGKRPSKRAIGIVPDA